MKRDKIEGLIGNLDKLKERMEYLKEEDLNIILEFDIYIEKKIKGKKECENER